MKILILHKDHTQAYELAQEMLTDLKAGGAETMVLPANKMALRFRQDQDLVVVLGGDGTILNTARFLAGTGIPLLGVNLGKIGFLSSIDPQEWPQARDKLLQRQYRVEDRMMIDIAVVQDGQECYRGQALNDAVIRSHVLHTITINLALNGQPYACYRGDGIICATPTGSTAYSYSAGGPVLFHQLEALAVTPVCPQLSSARSLIVPADKKLEFTIVSDHPTGIALDGREEMELIRGDRVMICKSSQTTGIVQIETRSSMKKIMQCRNKMP